MNPELLVPAGDFERLTAAVENGADAVYLGIKQFNARINACNFSFDELKKAVEYAHKNGVKVYVTLNTLVKNHEIKSFFEAVKQVYLSGADAVIIQELSFAQIIKQNFPNMEVHASTQSRIMNLESIKKLKDIDRVILARELSKAEVEFIAKNSPVPVEIFVHGALCFCTSGMCLMSSFIGGRSGNRGLCAQPCRKKYNDKYLMSMKDLCLIDFISELKQIGISALKIEGRMRTIFYVSTVTRIYRKALEGKVITEQDKEDLLLAFNREFTTGFFGTDKIKRVFDRPMNRGVYLGKVEGGKVKLSCNLSINDGIGIWKANEVVGEIIKEIRLNNKSVSHASKENIIELSSRQIAEGNEIYKTSGKVICERISYERKPILTPNRQPKQISLSEIKLNKSEPSFYVKVYDLQSVNEACESENVSVVIYPIDNKYVLEAKKVCTKKFYLALPPIVNDTEINEYKKKINEIKPDGILFSNLAFKGIYENEIADYNMNIFNDYDLAFFGKSIISPELNSSELKEFKNKDFIVFAHGNLVVMTTKNGLPEKITDEKGFTFMAVKEKDYYKLFNSKQIALLDYVIYLNKAGINQFYFDLDKRVKKWLDIYSKILRGENLNLKKIGKGFTKGHMERGVD